MNRQQIIETYEQLIKACDAYLELRGWAIDPKTRYGTYCDGIEDMDEDGINFHTYETWAYGGHQQSTQRISWEFIEAYDAERAILAGKDAEADRAKEQAKIDAAKAETDRREQEQLRRLAAKHPDALTQ